MNYCDNKCVGCIYLEVVSGGGWCHISGDCKYTPKEKPMADKIQMTEEQAREMYRVGINDLFDLDMEYENQFISSIKEKGYIKKSELETLVEEAEEMYNKQFRGTNDMKENVIKTLYETIQALKSTHPEFKKC